ncbi:29626_t:CDS:2, partial [Racocetra persica]
MPNAVLPPRSTGTSVETNIFTTSSISDASTTTLYTPVTKSSDEQPFIPSYLKGTFIEKLQNPNHLLCLPTCFKEYSS